MADPFLDRKPMKLPKNGSECGRCSFPLDTVVFCGE